MAGVAYNNKPRTPEVMVDESWFSDPNLCRESKVRALLGPTFKLFSFFSSSDLGLRERDYSDK